MNNEKAKLANKIVRMVRNKFNRKMTSDILNISIQNVSYIENLTTKINERNEVVYCFSKRSCQSVIDWYLETRGMI